MLKDNFIILKQNNMNELDAQNLINDYVLGLSNQRVIYKIQYLKIDRLKKGEYSGKAKLNKNQVIEIRNLYSNGTKAKVISEKFNISTENVCSIVSFKSWKI